ncbi:MAG: hypothetical protein COX50_09355 [Sulfurimonas sp. CG23_combo_of_CG06-09_8_20_14_all_36_33]|nr:MAG: hypothetical protein COX50_09355 [Sulfurimonas sp. CG23_combo_of_CG06-09_8_20_14_all_36_33]
MLGFRSLIALPVISLLAWFLEPQINEEALTNALFPLLFIGLFVFGVSKILWMEALHRISITKVSAMVAIVPPMTLFFAYLYLGEVPELHKLLGILPILLGGYLLTRPAKLLK